jgi:hypothetical protein
MNTILLLLGLAMLTNASSLFDFHKSCDISKWNIIDDVVMGGRSSGSFHLNENGNGVFKGIVSLENNGGFSSVRYRFAAKDVSPYESIVVRLKGDGKRYQLRVKSDKFDQHSYICHFQTSGEWETISVPWSSMYPAFRGFRLNKANFPGEVMEEIGFLIGNKTTEDFKLEIDWISLK